MLQILLFGRGDLFYYTLTRKGRGAGSTRIERRSQRTGIRQTALSRKRILLPIIIIIIIIIIIV